MLYLIGVVRDTNNKPVLRAHILSDDSHLGEASSLFNNGLMCVSIGRFTFEPDSEGSGLHIQTAPYRDDIPTQPFDELVLAHTLQGLGNAIEWNGYSEIPLLSKAFDILEARWADPKDPVNVLLEDAMIHHAGFKRTLVRDGAAVYRASNKG